MTFLLKLWKCGFYKQSSIIILKYYTKVNEKSPHVWSCFIVFSMLLHFFSSSSPCVYTHDFDYGPYIDYSKI